MKKHILAKLAVCGLACALGAHQTAFADDAALKTDQEKNGYAFGMSLGGSLKKAGISADADFLSKAVKAQLTDTPALMTTEEVVTVLKALPAGPTNLPAADKNFKNVKEEIGYAIGFNYGERLQGWGLEMSDLDLPDFTKGVQDAADGKPTSLTTNEVSALFATLQPKLTERQKVKAKELGEKNLKEGAEFLAKNKTEPGVITLTNGLQYMSLTTGTGPIPKLTDTVNVHYRGTFTNGKLFQDSEKAVPFGVNQVIPGWTQILQIMPTGSKWKVFIPSDLAYGPNGRPGIPPNSVLIFEMELFSIDPPKMMPPMTPLGNMPK